MNVSFLRNMTNMECVPCCRRRRWSLWKCCPRNTEWTRYSCYWIGLETSAKPGTIFLRQHGCVSCMILDVDNLHHKSQVSTALQCTRELENGYQRGAKTNNFLLDASHVSSRNMVSSSWTVTQSASYVPLRHPSDGKTCCRCQLITKKLRWCDTWLRLLVP